MLTSQWPHHAQVNSISLNKCKNSIKAISLRFLLHLSRYRSGYSRFNESECVFVWGFGRARYMVSWINIWEFYQFLTNCSLFFLRWELCPEQRTYFEYTQHLNAYLREEYHSLSVSVFLRFNASVFAVLIKEFFSYSLN